jgi:hypothetical protein
MGIAIARLSAPMPPITPEPDRFPAIRAGALAAKGEPKAA